MRKISLFTIFAVLLSGCATKYAPRSFWNDGGFTETEVQPGLFQVRFEGNEFTDTARTADFAMLRAAELCLSRGQTLMLLGDVATEVIQSGYVPGTTLLAVAHTGEGDVTRIISARLATSAERRLYEEI